MMNTWLRNHKVIRDRGSGWRSVFGVDSRQIWRASIFGIITCWLFLIASPKAFSQKEESAEYHVKLAFLYNFTKFVEWPPELLSRPRARPC